MSTLNRTPNQIIHRIETIARSDPFGWSRELLISYLPYSHAKPYLVDGVTEQQWESESRSTDPIADLIAYLPFAWDKALGERGISAVRSIDKIEQWLWLAGRDELLDAVLATPYEMYGKPKLQVVSDALAPEVTP